MGLMRFLRGSRRGAEHHEKGKVGEVVLFFALSDPVYQVLEVQEHYVNQIQAARWHRFSRYPHVYVRGRFI